MVRNYVPKTNRNTWEPAVLNRAIDAIEKNGMSIRQAALEFEISKSTFHERLKGQNFKRPSSGKKTIFTEDMEKALTDHILEMSETFYGLTTKEIRRIAYELAVALKLDHPFNKEKEEAGWDWFYSFMNRHPNLRLRKPENTSLNRIKGFCKEELENFYQNLGTVLEMNSIVPSKIYNMDETSLPTVPKLAKVVAKKGLKRLGKAVSAERGITTTLIACVSATGNYIPPFFVYRRKIKNDVLISHAPTGSDYEISDSGWTNEDIFLKWLQHFKLHSGATADYKTLLILDNHNSHCSLSAWKFCRENGIIMVSLPPHCSHRMQPLDLTIFYPLKRAFSDQCDNYLKTRKTAITVYDVAGIFAVAWNQSTNVKNAVNGFAASGIWPFNAQKFENKWREFQKEDQNGLIPATNPVENKNQPFDDQTTNFKEILKCISPSSIQTPQVQRNKKRGRPKGHSEVLTCTPKKDLLVEKEERKKNILAKKRTAVKRNLGLHIVFEPQPSSSTFEETSKPKPILPGKKALNSKTKKKSTGNSKDCEKNVWYCIYCKEQFEDPPKEDWIQCSNCEKCCHERCGKNEFARMKKVFKCIECKRE